jgi:hypothetical protein
MQRDKAECLIVIVPPTAVAATEERLIARYLPPGNRRSLPADDSDIPF